MERSQVSNSPPLELSPMLALNLLQERGLLLAQCGKHVRNVGSAVDNAVKISENRLAALTPEVRMGVVEMHIQAS